MIGRVDVLIAGAGVLGSGIAWALSERGITDVCVVDVDFEHRRSPMVHARPVRANWEAETNIRACRQTLDFMRANAELGFRAHGHLWLYDSEVSLAAAHERASSVAHVGLEMQFWSRDDVRKRFPLLDRAAEEIAGAEFAPNDGLADPCMIREWFRQRARDAGVRFLPGYYMEGLATSQREAGTRRLERIDLLEIAPSAGAKRAFELTQLLTAHSLPQGAERMRTAIRPGIVINALGPWSGVFAAKLGAVPIAVPRRRQLAVLALAGSTNERPGDHWPGLVADTAGAFFYPDSAYTVAGVEGRFEASGFDFGYDGEGFFQDRIWPHLAQRASCFEHVHHLRGLSLLDSVTPDSSGVLGWLDGFSNVLEAHSFPASGLMHVYAVARGLAELIVDGRFETLDLAPFSGRRFHAGEALVRESMRS